MKFIKNLVIAATISISFAAIAQTPVVDNSQFKVSTQDGVTQTDTSIMDFKDVVISDKVAVAILSAHENTNWRVYNHIKDNKVILEGFVPSEKDKKRAEDIARTASGKDVINQLVVGPVPKSPTLIELVKED